MKIDRILISVRPGETRIASLSQGDLIGLSFERFTQNSKVGDIFIGRIEAIVHNLQAAFVNLGDKKPGFLGLSDARPHGAKVEDTIGDYVSEGDHVLVQVIQSEKGNKGPRLTLRPALTGRNLVLMPGHSGILVSKRIKDTEIRFKLRKALAKNNIGSYGYVIRTSAQGAKIEDLLLEANYLRTKWAKIQSDRIATRGPKILFRETQKAYSLLRDIDVTNLTGVVTDNLETFYHLKTYTKSEIPEIQNLISLHREKEPLFRTEGIEEMIENALEPLVPLPNGGNIKIDETSALVAVDVNTGDADASGRDHMIKSVNCEAARILAKEIRLRNLSGLVVIDFINMRNSKYREDVLATLKQAVIDDPQQTFVGGFTRFGLVEMTRHRNGDSLSIFLCNGARPPQKTPITVGLEALRELAEEALAAPASYFILTVSKEMLPVFKYELATAFSEIKMKIGERLVLKTGETMKERTYLIHSTSKPFNY